MFSKPIFKQSIRSNWKLWVIITIVASVILSGFIMGYDAAGYASIAAASEGTVFSNILSSMTSLLGSLENFYKLIAVILGIVYVVFTANNLVVNEVDSGSMAYTLSTPIKRSSVIFTKSLYLIVSVVLMYAIVSVAGLGASQLKYGNVTGYAITDDVTAAADVLNVKERYLSERLYLIKEDERAMREAAVARNMDTEAYAIYLADAIKYRSYEEAAVIITNERRDRYAGDKDMIKDDIEITTDELVQNPAMILESNDALAAGARVQGGSINDYHQFIVEEITALELKKNADAKATTNEENKDTETQTQPQVVVTPDNTEHLLQAVVDSTSRTLGIKSSQISDNLTLIKDPKALQAATEATGLSQEQVVVLANQAMVSGARSVDKAMEFDVEAYFWLSIGLALLILAMSAIAFFASTLFNHTGLALAIGGGVPFAFFMITMVRQLMDSTDALKYLTITSLFDTDAILTNGEFGWGLVALAAISVVLYAAANVIFTKKDLPL